MKVVENRKKIFATLPLSLPLPPTQTHLLFIFVGKTRGWDWYRREHIWKFLKVRHCQFLIVLIYFFIFHYIFFNHKQIFFFISFSVCPAARAAWRQFSNLVLENISKYKEPKIKNSFLCLILVFVWPLVLRDTHFQIIKNTKKHKRVFKMIKEIKKNQINNF